MRYRFELFDGEAAMARFERSERMPDGTLILSGALEGDALSEAMLVQYGSAVSGHLRRGDGRFAELITLDGQLFVRELAEPVDSRLPDVAHAPATQVEQAPVTGDGSDDGSVIDLMVVYSDQARASRGGKDQMEALIRETVSSTNAAFERSAIRTRLRLVHSVEMTYAQATTLALDLNALTSQTDGRLDAIHALRQHYGADMVSLWLPSGSAGVAGVAWLGRNRDSDQSLGFSAIGTAFVLSQLTFAHELGHNFGAEHDRANATSSPELPYAFGYQNTTGRLYRTIMAYQCASADCPRVPYYSSSSILYEGGKTGDGITDNARAFNLTRTVLARYRTAVSDPAQSFSVSPASLSVPSGGGSFPVEVTADGAWRVSSPVTWLTISGAVGSGNGRFTVNVSPNPNGTIRTASLFAGPQLYTVVQAANPAGICVANPITPDAEISSTLTTCGPSTSATFTFRGVANQQVAVEARSTEFDAAISLLGPIGLNLPNGFGRTVAFNDDYRGALNARVPDSGGYVTLPVTGAYEILVYDTTSRTARGRFTVSLRSSPEYCRYSLPSALRFGGGLTATTLNIGTAGGCGWKLESSAGWIRFDLPDDTSGPREIPMFIDPIDDGQPRRGEITLTSAVLPQPLKLTVVQQPDTGACAADEIVPGQSVTSDLSAACTSPARGSGYGARRYRLNASAGQRLWMEARSTEFDPYLVLYAPSGAVIASNDDAGGSRNARIGAATDPLRLAEGAYIVEVSGFEPNSRGNVTLTVSNEVNAPAFESQYLAPSVPAVVDLPETADPALFASRVLEMDVPAQATSLDLTATLPPTEALTLHGRFGEPPAMADGAVVSDFSASAQEGRIEASVQPLRAGKLYLAFARESAGAAVTAELSARLNLPAVRAFQLLDQVMSTASQATPCAIPASRADSFRTTDRQALFAFLANADAGGTARVDFIGPDGVLRASVNVPSAAEGRTCGQAAYSLAGAESGTWKVRLLWDGREVFARSYVVSATAVQPPPGLTSGAPATLNAEGIALYRFVPAADASRVTFRLQPAAGADLDLYVRAGAAPATIGQRITADFASESPQGDETIVVDGSSLPALQSDSAYYVAAIARGGGAVRGTLSATVVIEPVTVTRAVTAVDTFCSAAVFETGAFRVGETFPVRFHVIGRVRTEASLEFEFVSPAGQRLPRAAASKVTVGPLCASGNLDRAQIAQAQNAGIGEWQARAYVNGELVVTRIFTLAGDPPATITLQSGVGSGITFFNPRADALLPTQYLITVPAGIPQLEIVVAKKSSSPATVNLEVLVRRGSRVVTTSQPDYSAISPSQSETLLIKDPPAGDYYIAVQSTAARQVEVGVRATFIR